MKKPINRIIIVGGGSAGWMTAAILCKRFPEKEIALIESPDIPTVGVGESTLGSINAFLHMLELKDSDWMEYCNATYKLSIKFRDFYKKGETFHYPFGQKDIKNTQRGVDDWYFKKTIHPETPTGDFVDSYYPQMPLIHQNKIFDNANNEIPLFNFQNDAAYHMDAALFGKFLREEYCIPRGVVFIKEHVDQYVLDHEGDLSHLVLRNGDELEADLFVDCTGFRSQILEDTMKVPFQSFEPWLPNNRAWTVHVPYTDKEKEIENVTCCTAINNGWVWNIPLYSRIGSGYVFCSKFISETDALEEYKQYLDSDMMTVPNPNRSKDLEFRLVKIKNGVHDVAWKNNVVAVGLSYGFIEPLESTGLLSVQEILVLLCETLENYQVNKIHVDNFNYVLNTMMHGFKLFVAYHYTFSSRRDTPYWKYVTEKITMDARMEDDYLRGLQTVAIDYGVRLIRSHTFREDMGGMVDVLIGMNQKPMNKFAYDWHLYGMKVKGVKDVNMFSDSTQQYWNTRNAHVSRVAANAPNHYQYLKNRIYRNKKEG